MLQSCVDWCGPCLVIGTIPAHLSVSGEGWLGLGVYCALWFLCYWYQAEDILAWGMLGNGGINIRYSLGTVLQLPSFQKHFLWVRSKEAGLGQLGWTSWQNNLSQGLSHRSAPHSVFHAHGTHGSLLVGGWLGIPVYKQKLSKQGVTHKILRMLFSRHSSLLKHIPNTEGIKSTPLPHPM